MIHLRVASPTAATPQLMAFLRGDDAVLNVVLLPETSEHPNGDTIHLDVLNGGANRVFSRLRELGIVEGGSVIAETVDAWLSDTAEAAERHQSRYEAFAPVWELVDARIRSDGTYPPSWFGLLLIAGLIAAIGILINSQILIVAAMVVGPEYGAIRAALPEPERDATAKPPSVGCVRFSSGLPEPSLHVWFSGSSFAPMELPLAPSSLVFGPSRTSSTVRTFSQSSLRSSPGLSESCR